MTRQSRESAGAQRIYVVTPLIEALQERYEGEPSKGKSAIFFKEQAKKMFAINEEALILLYNGLRCGFAHHGFLKDDKNYYNILITSGLIDLIKYGNKVLWIDSHKYVYRIRDAYDEYYKIVESDSELLTRFMKIWNADWQMSLRVPGGAGTGESSHI